LSEIDFEYAFPAIRGVQAGREYYVTQFPLSMISRVLSFDDSDLPPEMRAQRILNSQRVPEMVDYIITNRNDYVFSALTASVDADVVFDVLEGVRNDSLGTLRIPMEARFVVNDGQHRRAAIKEALEQDPSLRHETVAMVLFLDRGLERSQQMFADLNRHAVRPSSSIGILYDHRDPLAAVTRSFISRLVWLSDVVELEKTTLTPRSRKLFTLSALFTGTRALMTGLDLTPEEQIELGCEFWDGIAEGFPEWKEVQKRKASSAELRDAFIYTHGLALHSMGLLGNSLLMAGDPVNWRCVGKQLGEIDWRRSNTKLWEGRAMTGGRVQKGYQNVMLTTNALKLHLGIPLSDEEVRAEQALRGKVTQ
jgi:DNA sulfur modification protein DndB